MDKTDFSFNDILQNPTVYYELPEEVLTDDSLTEKQKMQVLEQWKYDAILMQTATAENMSGGESSPLDKILKCLNELEK